MRGIGITNMTKIEIVSADTAAFLNSANALGVFLYNIRYISVFCVHCWIKTSDYNCLHHLCERQGTEVNIIKKKGIRELLRIISKRPVLLAGVLLFITFLLYIPTRVLFIQVEGNQNLSEYEIISAAESCGIYVGASRKQVRSEKVKNNLLSELGGTLQWAGVTTKGCVAVISIKEKTETTEMKPATVSSIVASRDGIITSCVYEEGNLLCTVGQAVRKGQLLISGFTDCGLSIRATNASGEITAKTHHKISVIIPTESMQRLNTIAQKKKISLLIGKKRINLWKDSGICDTTCDRIYKEYYVMLPGGYSLPVGISIDSCNIYQTDVNKNTLDSICDMAADYAREYVHHQMIAGSILKGTESFATYGSWICMKGEYVCTEMIGIVRREQIGE